MLLLLLLLLLLLDVEDADAEAAAADDDAAFVATAFADEEAAPLAGAAFLPVETPDWKFYRK